MAVKKVKKKNRGKIIKNHVEEIEEKTQIEKSGRGKDKYRYLDNKI